MELNAKKALAIRTAGHPVLLLSMPGDCRIFALDRERLVLGSGLAAEIPVRLPGVADRHLLIQRQEGGFEFFDLSQGQGILQNGQRREAGELVHADEFVVGNAHMVMVDPEADAMPPGLQLLGLPLPLLRAEAEKELAERHQPEETFHEILLDSLKNTPWLLLSAGAHALIWVALIAILGGEEPVDRAKPELGVEMADSFESFDDLELEEEFAEYEPELDTPIEEEEVTIDESTETESQDDEDLFEDDPGDPGERSNLGMSAAAMGDAGRGLGQSGQGGLGGSSEKIVKTVGKLRQSGLDLVIVIDTTSSMNEEIEAAKAQVATVISSLSGLGIEFRLGVVAFRDNGSSEAYVTIEQELTPYVYKAVGFMDQLTPAGGGDEPEAVFEALQAATSMKFSRNAEKILILVGDAPPHPDSRGAFDDRITRLLKRFERRGGCLHTILAEPRRGRGRSEIARAAFQQMASTTGGQAVELRQASQLVRDVLAVTLSAENDQDVASLMNEFERSRTTDAIRRRLRSHDPGFIETMLRASPMHPRLPMELSRQNHRAFLPAYVNILRDEEIDLQNRWLATVMLRRLIVQVMPTSRFSWPKSVRAAYAELDPEDRFSRQKSLLDDLARALFDAGLIEASIDER